MAERCWRSAAHAEGEVDERIAAFYEELLTRFPPDSPDSPWMAGLDASIDHVIMNLSWSCPVQSKVASVLPSELGVRKLGLDPCTDWCPELGCAFGDHGWHLRRRSGWLALRGSYPGRRERRARGDQGTASVC
jgi:hypothetical protein